MGVQEQFAYWKEEEPEREPSVHVRESEYVSDEHSCPEGVVSTE